VSFPIFARRHAKRSGRSYIALHDRISVTSGRARSASALLNSTLTMWSILTRHGYPAWSTQTIVEGPAIRLLIREKLKDGQLPYDSMPRFWGGPSTEEICDACDLRIEKTQLVLEGIASTRSHKKPIQFHVVCFQLWDHEKREAPK
jgi:hypothetical protein